MHQEPKLALRIMVNQQCLWDVIRHLLSDGFVIIIQHFVAAATEVHHHVHQFTFILVSRRCTKFHSVRGIHKKLLPPYHQKCDEAATSSSISIAVRFGYSQLIVLMSWLSVNSHVSRVYCRFMTSALSVLAGGIDCMATIGAVRTRDAPIKHWPIITWSIIGA